MMRSAANPQREISLTVEQAGGRSILVMTGLKRTVRDVKEEICKLTGLSPQFQILTYGPEVLKDTDTMERKEIVDGDIIFLQPRYDDSMNSIRIIASDDASQTKSFRIEKKATVDEILAKVSSYYPPAIPISLVLHGEALERGKTLSDYELQEGETVHLKIITEQIGGAK